MAVRPPRVRFELGDDAVAVITLDRPDRRNALDHAAFQGLHDAAARANEAAAAGRCRAVLLLGAGPAFCSGIDTALLAEQASGHAADEQRLAWMQQAFTAYEDLPVPTVAAVRGSALGAGCQLALAAHLRVAAADARFALLEARWGLVPDLGATWRLPRLVGLGRATDLALRAITIDAATAHAWGLVNEVLAAEGFEVAARAWAAQLAAGPTAATGPLPALLRNSYARFRDEVLAGERRAQAACLGSEDFHEAAAAQAAGREPRFRGR
jgi:enoyl-CoA hydratase/carnithine racemase